MSKKRCCYKSADNNSSPRAMESGLNYLHLIFLLIVTFAAQPGLANTAAVGSTAGNFRVSESGAATYTIPIVVPPGTAGMAPSLSLSYSSQSGNGILGMGWSLSGLSAIYRCPATIAQDGFKGSINFDSNDRFCLDGQRLVAVNGNYGENGTEYRTEAESYSRIISYGSAGNGPAWFKVWTKAGQIANYGNTGNSRIEAQGRADVQLWNANKISDTKGNYLTVSYNEDNANGEFYVSRIDYTGNAAAGLAPYASVRFSYEVRPDSSIGYETGSVIKSTKRITNIKTYNGSVLVKDYRTAYEQSSSSNRSRLASLNECDAIGMCLPQTKFGWQGAVGVYSSAQFNTGVLYNGGEETLYSVLSTEVNGDGKTDLVHVRTDHNSLLFERW